jgi:tRNA threonylcarbamoyladenosine biosynthesis protein TsaB
MLVLAIDTSGKDGSIALVRANAKGSCQTLELVPLQGGTFSAQLVPEIAALLRKHDLSKTDVDAFAVASGPGSFTGLRVGLAAVKALADVLQKPIATVSLLQAVAQRSSTPGTVIAAMDAGRGEVYAGVYQASDGESVCLREELLTISDFGRSTMPVVTPDSAVADVIAGLGLTVRLVPRPRSDAIAVLGLHKILTGETVSPDSLEANYIRRSDAEIFSRG